MLSTSHFTAASLSSLGLFSAPASPFLQTAPSAIRENDLTQELLYSELDASFEIISQLRTLYVRNARSGGLLGIRWLEGVQNSVHQHIQDSHLYGIFLRENDGRTTLKLPHGLPRPAALRMGEDMTVASVLHLPDQNIPGVGALAYFRIDDLLLGQDLMSVGKIVFFKNLIERLGFSPVVVARDLKQAEVYHLHDGHHRTYAALKNGYRYILGKMNREAQVQRSSYSWETMTFLPHDEFLRRIQPNLVPAFADAPVDGNLP